MKACLRAIKNRTKKILKPRPRPRPIKSESGPNQHDFKNVLPETTTKAPPSNSNMQPRLKTTERLSGKSRDFDAFVLFCIIWTFFFFKPMSLYHSHTRTQRTQFRSLLIWHWNWTWCCFKKKLPTPHTDDFRNTKATLKECYLQKNFLLLFLSNNVLMRKYEKNKSHCSLVL